MYSTVQLYDGTEGFQVLVWLPVVVQMGQMVQDGHVVQVVQLQVQVQVQVQVMHGCSECSECM